MRLVPLSLLLALPAALMAQHAYTPADIEEGGRLFRTNVDQHIKRNLIIFVTARLVNPAGVPVNSVEEEEERVMERFEKIGAQLMHRSGGGMMDGNPFAATLGDPMKRKLVAGLLGQAFVIAYCTVKLNYDGVDRVATRLVSEGEMYGDDVVDLLDSAELRKPDIDVLDEDTWPVI